MDATPDTWRWIWLMIAAVLITGEMFVVGTFILIPFGLSASVAMVMAFFGAPLLIDWIVFVGLGCLLFSIFWKKSRASMAAMKSPPGAGHDRLIGVLGRTLETIPADPAESGDRGGGFRPDPPHPPIPTGGSVRGRVEEDRVEHRYHDHRKHGGHAEP